MSACQARRAASRQAAEFHRGQAEGYASRDRAERGSNVSEGQRQRLAIARAPGDRPQDPRLRRQLLCARLQDRLPRSAPALARMALQRRAVVIVAQRVATIMHADQIIGAR
ncbi:MAG: hypothetical protein ACLTSX_00465 [Collinsella sp.]